MRWGFSLVEMLVVIAIVLLLVALVLPVFSFVTEQAKIVQCASNLRTLHIGLTGYASDNRGNMPYYWDEDNYFDNLDATPMWWGFPAFQYIVNNFPDINPYTNAPWKNPNEWQSFSKLLAQQYRQEWEIFFCQAGDNYYYAQAYEGERMYPSNYYGYFGPDRDIFSIGNRRSYQTSTPSGFNRPINAGLDIAGTWLLADFHWNVNRNEDPRWGVDTAHKDYSKNILHLDGSVVFTRPEFWIREDIWLDRFPKY